jgi:hypothetical protein
MQNGVQEEEEALVSSSRYQGMSHTPNPANTITLKKPEGDGWHVYAQVTAAFRKIDDAAVDFTIAWMDGIECGHRVSDRNGRSGRTWIVVAVFRTNATAARPDLILTCRRVSEK